MTEFIEVTEIRSYEYTGKGYYIHFDIENIQDLTSSSKKSNVIVGPYIKHPELTREAGSQLYIVADQVKMLEIFSFDETFPKDPKNYTLS